MLCLNKDSTIRLCSICWNEYGFSCFLERWGWASKLLVGFCSGISWSTQRARSLFCRHNDSNENIQWLAFYFRDIFSNWQAGFPCCRCLMIHKEGQFNLSIILEAISDQQMIQAPYCSHTHTQDGNQSIFPKYIYSWSI